MSADMSADFATDAPVPRDRLERAFPIVIAGLMAVALCGWFWMAHSAREFVWGEGHAQRPIVRVMLLLAAQYLIWGAILGLFEKLHGRRRWWTTVLCCVAGLTAQLCFLTANPILEHDGYRYLLDGATLNAGVNPYRYAPSELLSHGATADLDTATRAMLQEFHEDPTAIRTLERVGYPDVKTIYPPVAQAVFWLAFKLDGWSWTGLRILFIAAYFGGLVLTAAASKSDRALVMLALCPLAIKEIGNSAHVDAMPVLYFGAFLFLIAKREHVSPRTLAVLSGVLLALAIATKLYPVVAVPLIAAWFGARFSWRLCALFLTSIVVALACLYAPFVAMGERTFFSALTPFGNSWLRNPGLFALLQNSASLAFGDAPVSLSWFPGATGPLSFVVAKCIAAILLFAVLAATTRHIVKHARTCEPIALLSASLSVLLLAWFMLLPMAFPWYLLGALPFLATARSGVWPLILIASVGVFYYGDFYIDAHDLPAPYPTRLLQIEYGIPFIAALLLLLKTILTKRSKASSLTGPRA